LVKSPVPPLLERHAGVLQRPHDLGHASLPVAVGNLEPIADQH
jgi:hypothetical protein